MTGRGRELRITDPRALRALAHPARQRLISELFAGEVLTATEAARWCGLSPSAMSYHLRALERWGIVERDESGDARERPWRATADRISVAPEAYVGSGDERSRASLRAMFPDLEADLERLATSAGRDGLRGMASRGRLWLTQDEAKEVIARLEEAMEPYEERSRRRHPQGAQPWSVYTILAPQDRDGPG